MSQIADLGEKIVKGVISRFKSKQPSRYPGIGWLQQKVLKHQDDRSEKDITINKLTIFYKRPYELLYTYNALFIEELYRFPATDRAPVVLDCGANIGLSILYYKTLYPSAIIHAYEADKNNFLLLQKNIEVNQLKNVQAHFAAVWTHTGIVSFHAEGSEASHVLENENHKTNPVPSLSLTDILQQHEHIDFLKIDIEGAEWQVLTQSGDSLQKAANVFIEYHGNVDETQKLADLIQLMTSKGYKVYVNHATDQLKQPFYNRSSGLTYDIQLHLFCYR